MGKNIRSPSIQDQARTIMPGQSRVIPGVHTARVLLYDAPTTTWFMGDAFMQFEGRAREKRNEARPVKPKAWPFYVVYDVSNSMWNEDQHGDYTPWHVMRTALPS